MWNKKWLAALLLGLAVASCVADLQDLQSGFEFIYHENHNLLLTIYNGSCYFSDVPREIKEQMSQDSLKITEGRIALIITSEGTERPSVWTLDDMRDKYADLLANFHCTDKHIYSLELFTPQCDFESPAEPLCSFTQDTTDKFDWTWHSGPTNTTDTGPLADHTYGVNGTGHYLYIEGSEPRIDNDTARLISEVLKASDRSPYCLRFSYNMHGFGVGTLNVYAVPKDWVKPDVPLPNPIWSKSGEQGQEWRKATVDISESIDFQIVFEGITGKTFYTDIAIDDISVSRGPCTVTCDFDSLSDHTCDFIHDTTGDFNWTLGHGATPTNNTGPTADHTLGTAAVIPGHYMYIESSEPRNPNDTARMIQQVSFSPSGASRCLRFYYHMYGRGIGTLSVHVRNDNFPEGFTASLLTLSGDQGNEWKQAEITVPLKTEFELVFEAVIGQDYFQYGDIAVDDIEISEGVCKNSSNTTVDSTTSTQSPYVYSITEDHLQCDFGESGDAWCGFIQDHTDNMDWTRGKTGQTHHTAGTGPPGGYIDSTYEFFFGADLYYIFINSSSSHKDGEKARLISQVFDPTSHVDHCLQFYYSMHGVDTGTLNVYVVEPNSLSQLPSPIWTAFGEHGIVWLPASVNIPARGQFQIVFEGTVRSGPLGDIALDDISLFIGACTSNAGGFTQPQAYTTTTTRTTTTTTTGRLTPGVPMQARLVGGTSTAGLLEVNIHGQWFTVCSENFGDFEASVACHMVGHEAQHTRHGVLQGTQFTPTTSSMWTDLVNCGASDTSFSGCSIHPKEHCAGHSVAIYCGNPCIIPGDNPHDGGTWHAPSISGCGDCTCDNGHHHCTGHGIFCNN